MENLIELIDEVRKDGQKWRARSYMIGDVISREKNHSTISSKYAFRYERDLKIYKNLLPISV